MTTGTAKRLAWGAWSVAMVLALAALAFLYLGRHTPPPSNSFGFRGFGALFAVTFASVGALIAARHPANAIGWIFCAMGVVSGLQEAAQQYAIYGVLTRAADPLPLGAYAAWIPSWIWIPATSGVAYLLLLFPDGRLPSPGWRKVAVFQLVATVWASTAYALIPGPLQNFFSVSSPVSLGSRGVMLAIGAVGQFFYGAGIIAAAVALVRRFRRSVGEEREQLKWLAAAGSLVAISLFGSFIGAGLDTAANAQVPFWISLVVIGAFLCVPISTGIAISKYRLYDIDVVINKTLVYGTLAGFITLLYVGIVVGVGAVLGRGGRHNTALAIAATAAVALAFQPARDRVQRFANRLVYGSRATPYEVMAGFAHRVAGTLSTDQLLPEMAEAAARGVGAARSRVRLFLPGGGERVVVWPDDSPRDGSEARAIDVTYHGAPIGEILVEKPEGQLTPAEQKLLSDLASQAGLAMHNVRLTDELATRLQELAEQSAALQISRQRLVTARDVQRRGLERDIREGPQRQLLDIGGRIGDARRLAGSDPKATEQILDQLGSQATSTLEGLRDLARGIFPPLLAEKGVVAALDAHIRKVGANATIEAAAAFTERRYDADTEAALYFISLQALQNVSRHTDGAAAIVRLDRDGGDLVLEIADDGPGFDVADTPAGMGIQIMQDRVDALDGSLQVRASTGGAIVTCRVPVRTTESA